MNRVAVAGLFVLMLVPLTGIDCLSSALDADMRRFALPGEYNPSAELDTDEADAGQAQQGLEAIVTLRGVLTATKESTNQFRQTMAALPRMTSGLNRAKRGVVSVLDRLMDEFRNGQTLLRESEGIIRDLLGKEDGE